MSFKAATDWYGNIVGKNLYKDYDLCFIVGTNNMPLPIYLLQFYQYSTEQTLVNCQIRWH